MSEPHSFIVEVACATPAKQRIVRLDVQSGTTARQAVIAAGLQNEFPELDLSLLCLGIYGEVVPDERILQPGERVEVYRPLKHEPIEARRLQAARSRAKSGGIRKS